MKHNKIYIIGPVGSGKTYFSRKLSEKYKIERYELDKVAWDDSIHVKRTDEEAIKLLKEIINKKSWVVEDIGRDKFMLARDKADIIYYIKLTKLKSYFRVTKRWIKQRLGFEIYNDTPNFAQLKYYYSTVKSYYKKEKHRLESLKPYSDKLVFINKRNIKKILNSK